MCQSLVQGTKLLLVQSNCLMANKINLKEPGHYALWKAWGWPFRSELFWSMRDTCHSLQKAPCCYHKESPAGCTGPHFPGNSFFLHWGKQGFLRFSFRVRITMVIRWLSVGLLVQCHLSHCVGGTAGESVLWLHDALLNLGSDVYRLVTEMYPALASVFSSVK